MNEFEFRRLLVTQENAIRKLGEELDRLRDDNDLALDPFEALVLRVLELERTALRRVDVRRGLS